MLFDLILALLKLLTIYDFIVDPSFLDEFFLDSAPTRFLRRARAFLSLLEFVISASS